MDITAFAVSTEGLLTAVGTCLSGFAALLTAYNKIRLKGKQTKEVKMGARQKIPGYAVGTLVMGVCLLLVSGVLLLTRAYSESQYPLNVELTKAAWDAYNKGDFERAIGNADKCIKEFRGAADREQEKLEKSKLTLPPTGKVSKEEKETILARGLLNDVATCFYIRGRAAENLGRLVEAKQAYKSASKYSYARCWDPKGWFWSPAEAAQDRLATLD